MDGARNLKPVAKWGQGQGHRGQFLCMRQTSNFIWLLYALKRRRGSRGRARGRGLEERIHPETETLLACKHSTEAANLPAFSIFGKTKVTDIYAVLQK